MVVNEWVSPPIGWNMLSTNGPAHHSLEAITHPPITYQMFGSAKFISRGHLSLGAQSKLNWPCKTRPTIAITHKFCDVYYHWLFDIVPRLMHAMVEFGESACFAIDRPRFRYQREWLALAAPTVSPSFLPLSEDVLSSPILVPSPSTTGTVVSPWACHAVRKAARGVPASKGASKVYIQRQGKISRKIVNEAELERYLKQKGFISVDLCAISVEEQVALFKGSDVIVSAHGSSLANLAFCNPGTTVIEIFGPNCGETCYPRIAQQMQLQHLGIQSDELAFLSIADRIRHRLGMPNAPFHFKANLDLLKQALSL